MTLPFMAGLAVTATPIFHTLFGQKWDEAIPLFQILMVRGILIVYISLCTNYILSLGYAKSLVIIEGVKDGATLLAIALTLPFGSVEALVWGQLGASLITYLYILQRVKRATGVKVRSLAASQWLYLLPCAPALVLMGGLGLISLSAPLLLALQLAAGLSLYIVTLSLTKDSILAEAKRKVFGRFQRRK